MPRPVDSRLPTAAWTNARTRLPTCPQPLLLLRCAFSEPDRARSVRHVLGLKCQACPRLHTHTKTHHTVGQPGDGCYLVFGGAKPERTGTRRLPLVPPFREEPPPAL